MVTNATFKETERRACHIVGAFGSFNGNEYEMYPPIPDIFTTGLDFYGIAYDVDFLKVETSDKGLVCWFIDKEEDTFFLPLHQVLSNEPMLYSAIISYLLSI